MSLGSLLIRSPFRRLGYVRHLPFRVNFHTTNRLRAGHSKWANIRHIKAAKDGQRSAIFSRLVRQIRMAIQEGGSTNPQLNTLLRNAVDDALKKNMPMTTIQNTIKRSDTSKAQLKKFCLEIKLVNTPIYLVCVLYSENLAGLRMQMTPIMKKAGGTFVEARHLFESRGVVEAIAPDKTEEDIMADAIDVGAEEYEMIDETSRSVNFICDANELDRVNRALVDRGYEVENAQQIFLPKSPVTVGEAEIKMCDTLRDKLKALDGVDELFDNINFDAQKKCF